MESYFLLLFKEKCVKILLILFECLFLAHYLIWGLNLIFHFYVEVVLTIDFFINNVDVNTFTLSLFVLPLIKLSYSSNSISFSSTFQLCQFSIQSSVLTTLLFSARFSLNQSKFSLFIPLWVIQSISDFSQATYKYARGIHFSVFRIYMHLLLI